ncbi:MAG: hypothetical protein ACRD4G_11525, partial [Bryobacteraceae bacterium]
MKIRSYLALLTSGSVALCLAAAPHLNAWPVRQQQTIQKTFTLSGSPMQLVVKNVNGWVHVTGIGGSQVRVTAHKTIRAETDSDVQQAKREVHLDMTDQAGTVTIAYDGPNHGGHRTYNVRYDIDVQVPRNARTDVGTVNGPIVVGGVAGHFDVHSVNGPLTMTGIAGSGDVHTVNGAISVHFAKNPSAASSFKTVNGAIDAYFQKGLSAGLRFQTLHGGIYSDFDVNATAAANASASVEHNGKFVYR